MAKKKDSTALFEVIQKTREKRSAAGLAIPAWMSTRREGEEQQDPAQVVESEGVLEPEELEPFAVPEGRLQLSLSYVSCMVIFLALVLLLAGVFALGRYSVSGKAPASVAGMGEGVSAPGENVSDATAAQQRVGGLYYLILQRLVGATATDRADAENIVAFCKAMNVNATVQEFTTGGAGNFLAAWSLRGFEDPAGEDAVAYALEIEKLGKEYFRTHGKYRFQQRLSPSSPLRPYYQRQE